MTHDTAIAAAPPLELDNLTVRFGRVTALAGVSLAVERGEHLAVIGPSGAGKTTLLRCVAGLVRPASGEVRFRGNVWSAPDGSGEPPERRRIGMLTQTPSLWPHLTARKHLMLALRWRRVPHAQRPAEAQRLLDLVGLAHRADHRPAMLSGGEAQRLALARALAGGSEILLLDEPLAHLDAALRDEAAAVITRSARAMAATVIHVTHHVADAMNLAGRVAVLEHGRVTQVAPPSQLLAQPATRFIATVLGYTNVVAPDQATLLPDAWRLTPADAGVKALADGCLAFAPDRLEVSGDGACAEVIAPVFHGGRWLLRVKCGALELQVPHDCALPPGSRVGVRPSSAVTG